MKNKIIAIFLCVCTLVPFFAIFSFAEGAEKAVSTDSGYYVYPDLYEMIDVNSYINKRGQSGYDQMKLLGFSEPSITIRPVKDGEYSYNMYDVSYLAYIYNPNLEYIVNVPYDTGYDTSCYIEGCDMYHIGSCGVGVDGAKYVHSWIDYRGGYGEKADHFVIYDTLFFAVAFRMTYDEWNYKSEGVFNINGLSFDIFRGKKPESEDWYESQDIYDEKYLNYYQTCTLDLDIELNYTDINHMLSYTSAYTDMSTFLGVTVEKLESEYPLSESLDSVVPAFLYEDYDNKKLYLYIYDSNARQSFDSILNEVYMSVDGVNYNLYELEFINFEGTLSKFLISGAGVLVDDNSDTRSYYINSLQYRGGYGLRKWSGTSYWTYSLDSNGEIEVDSKIDYLDLIDVGHTYYRLDSSPNGMKYYQTLSSVYFSMPESYFELDDADYLNDRWIERIKGQYEWAMTNPGIISQHYTDFISYLIKAQEAGTNLEGVIRLWAEKISGEPFIGIGSSKDGSSVDNCVYEFEDISFFICDHNCYCPPDCEYCEEYYGGICCSKRYDTACHVSWYNSDFRELKVDEIDILTALFNVSQEKAFQDSFKQEVFEFSKDDVLQLLSYNEMSIKTMIDEFNFFQYLVILFKKYKYDCAEAIGDINVFQTFYQEDIDAALLLSKEDFLNKYYVASSDYEEICEKMRYARDNSEVFILLRFDTYDYMATKFNMYEQSWLYSECYDSVMVIDKVYKDFELLEIELKNQYNSKVYTIDMDPITFMSNVTTPTYTELPDLNADINFFPDAFINEYNEYKDAILMVLGIILVIALIVVVWVYVVIPISRFVSRK